jgi:hypothetical protein
MAFIKLDTIIRQLCRATGEPEYRNYDTILEHVVACCRQLNLLAIPVVAVAELKSNSYNAVNWPLDCVKPLSLGQMRGDRLVTLSLDESMVSGNLAQPYATISEAEQQVNNILNGHFTPETGLASTVNGEMYGYGNGFNYLGYVSHDKKARQSYIKATTIKEGDKFIMSYKSDGVSCGLECVPSEAELCIKAFALEQYYTIKNPGIASQQRQRYKEEFSALTKLNMAYTADDWSDMFTQWNNTTP